MMNKILPFLIALMPTVCLGLDDACTKPSEFTIDKRCYVTNEQKETYPYNTVVALIRYDGYVYCTGTIINESNGIKRVYTAKHCTDVNEDNVVDETITIQTQDGARYKVTNTGIMPPEAYGDHNIEKDTLFSGDWAKYDLIDAPDNFPSTTFTTRHSGFLGMFEATAEKSFVPEKHSWPLYSYDAQVVGYGSLKIMSDKEIQDFKDKYTKFLKTSLAAAVEKKYKDDGLSPDEMQEKIEYYEENNFLTGLYRESVLIKNPIVKEFIHGELENALSLNDYLALFNDDNLKTSLCQLSVDGYQQGCQSWYGNSGGPIFDKDGHLMGILTGGIAIIGGELHAGRDYHNPDNSDGTRGDEPDGRPDDNIHFLKLY